MWYNFYVFPLICHIPSRRAALEKWKQNNGRDATYNNLIGVFKQAGYQEYADHVYVVLQCEHRYKPNN